jgi:hypothetical protein
MVCTALRATGAVGTVGNGRLGGRDNTHSPIERGRPDRAENRIAERLIVYLEQTLGITVK